MSGKNYVATKSTNSLLVRTQGLLTEMANFAQEVELQWGIEEKTRADSALRVIDTVLFDNGITWSEVINDEQRRNNIVSVIDKILNKGTGSMTFGTVSTPVTAGQPARFIFSNILEVYENYKVLKELIDEKTAQVVKE
jgi:hypothetical protein